MGERKITLDKKINKFKLDEELEMQPDIYLYWARNAASAKEERDHVKNQLKKLEGEVEVKIWTGKYELPEDTKGKPIKLTAGTVAALVDSDVGVFNLREELAVAEKNFSRAAAAEEAIQQKRSSLKHLTELYVKEYFTHTGADGSVVPKLDQDSREYRKNLGKDKKKKKSQED